MIKTSRILNSFKPNQTAKLDTLCFPINLTKPPNFNSSTSTSISNSTILHLHQLSALKVPKESTKEFDSLKSNLQEILKIINSIHDFPEPKPNHDESIQDLILFKSKDHQINWKELLNTQQTFLNSKSKSIPGLHSTKKEVKETLNLKESNQLEEMSLNHLIKRKGLGNSPNQESLYYYVKRVNEKDLE